MLLEDGIQHDSPIGILEGDSYFLLADISWQDNPTSAESGHRVDDLSQRGILPFDRHPLRQLRLAARGRHGQVCERENCDYRRTPDHDVSPLRAIHMRRRLTRWRLAAAF